MNDSDIMSDETIESYQKDAYAEAKSAKFP